MSSNECQFTCGFGTCVRNVCECNANYFGRTCSKEIYKASEDTFQTTVTVKQFESIYYYDDITKGDPEVNYDIRSGDNPKMLFIVNESTEQNNEIFFRHEDRTKRDDTSYYLLGEMESSGQQKSSFVAEKTHVYMRFTNYDAKEAHIDLRVSSKLLRIILF